MNDTTDRPGDRPDDVVVGNDQPTNQPPGTRDQPPTDQSSAVLVSLEDAAVQLGITVNAVRQRIKRGTVVGVKTDAGWMVDMSHRPTTDQPFMSATNHATDQGVSPTNQQPTIDLAPLVEHIASLEDQVQRLTEATTMWQIRARQAEEQLKQLAVGEPLVDSAQETSPEPRGSTESDRIPESGIRRWWNRWRDTW